jgi:hypothetical protein
MDGEKPQGKSGGGQRSGIGAGGPKPAFSEDVKRDLSLKDGETITINIGGKGKRTANSSSSSTSASGSGLFSIAPPPSTSGSSASTAFLPPPPSAASVRAEKKRQSREIPAPQPTAEELGFDDGEFGEFQ